MSRGAAKPLGAVRGKAPKKPQGQCSCCGNPTSSVETLRLASGLERKARAKAVAIAKPCTT